MDPTTPDENETKKPAATPRNSRVHRRYATYALYLVLLLIVIRHFLKQFPVVEYAIAIIIIAMLLAAFYLVVKGEFIRK